MTMTTKIDPKKEENFAYSKVAGWFTMAVTVSRWFEWTQMIYSRVWWVCCPLNIYVCVEEVISMTTISHRNVYVKYTYVYKKIYM